MKTFTKIKAALTIFTITFSSFTAHAGRVNTADYWKCSNRTGGSWIFGTAPKACAAKSFISERFVEEKYSPYIFNERNSHSSERVRYMTEMHHLVNEAAEYYIKKRKPSASATEIKWWKRAILAITHQESFMTHYRKGNDRTLRMMRGDFGHGHGLMQVDDRWHFSAVKEGRAANLIDNLFYALDIYYKGWQSAPSKSCVKSSSDYYNRARAAYGVYNGGSSAACRFTNPNHKWARNDKNFKSKFDGQSWTRYISSTQKPQDVNVACLSNNSASNCGVKPVPPKPPTQPTPPPVRQGKVLKYKDFLCALESNSYHCISQPAQRFCLVDKYNLINEVIRTIAVKPVVLLSKDDVCQDNSATPLEVGSFVRVKKNINLRETPGGRWQDILKAEETYQILDVHTVAEKNHARYYLIKRGSKLGYFYAGDKNNHRDWARTSASAKEVLIPVTGSTVSVATNGTNLRHSPGGDKLITVPGKTNLKVLSTVISGETNKLYIEVEYRGHKGFMYSGQIHPKNTVKNWIILK